MKKENTAIAYNELNEAFGENSVSDEEEEIE